MNEYSYKEIFQDNNIEVVKTCDKSTDDYGNEFITLTSGGVKEPGEVFPSLFSTQKQAAKRFEDVLLVWLNGRRRIYVRMFPQMRTVTLFKESLHDEFSKADYYNVVMRLTAY